MGLHRKPPLRGGLATLARRGPREVLPPGVGSAGLRRSRGGVLFGVTRGSTTGRVRLGQESMSVRLNADGSLDLRETFNKARQDLRIAPAVARHAVDAAAPNDNVNKAKRIDVVARGLCRGPCGANVSRQFVMPEPNGCLGVRGVSLATRFNALGCPPLEPPDCLLVSIGIGMEWGFELQMAAKGCEVHAFDPTVAMNSSHTAAATMFRTTYPRLHYHYRGLGDDADRKRGTIKEYSGSVTDSTGSTLGPLQQMDDLLRHVGKQPCTHACSKRP